MRAKLIVQSISLTAFGKATVKQFLSSVRKSLENLNNGHSNFLHIYFFKNELSRFKDKG